MVKRPLCSGAKGRRFESCQAYQDSKGLKSRQGIRQKYKLVQVHILQSRSATFDAASRLAEVTA